MKKSDYEQFIYLVTAHGIEATKKDANKFSRFNHLKRLDSYISTFAGSALQSFPEYSYIEKNIHGKMGEKLRGEEYKKFYQYYHIKAGPSKTNTHRIRLSTCLIPTGDIYFPNYEFDEDADQFYFLAKDNNLDRYVFLVIDAKKLFDRMRIGLVSWDNPHLNDHGNYNKQVAVETLFELRTVLRYGVILKQDQFYKGQSHIVWRLYEGFNKSKKINLTPRIKNFEKYQLRGCMEGKKERIVMWNINNEFVNTSLRLQHFKTYDSIYACYMENHMSYQSQQALRMQQISNSKAILNNIYSQRGFLKNSEGLWMLFDLSELGDFDFEYKIKSLNSYCSEFKRSRKKKADILSLKVDYEENMLNRSDWLEWVEKNLFPEFQAGIKHYQELGIWKEVLRLHGNNRIKK